MNVIEYWNETITGAFKEAGGTGLSNSKEQDAEQAEQLIICSSVALSCTVFHKYRAIESQDS